MPSVRRNHSEVNILGKTFRAYSLTIFAICVLSLLGSVAYGQDRDNDKGRDHHRGIVQDWSGHHMAYARYGSLKALLAAQQDPRAITAWEDAFRKDWNRWKHGTSTQVTEHRDWSINLGSGGTAASMYPAKYNFSPTATPDCTNDYVVFPINVAGTSSQPNIVAFNNLYSGTTPANGICNRTPVAFVDTGVAATTLWSYAVQGITGGGSVTTSPSLSEDGTKVAFVESLAGNPAHFHVLAWKSADGQTSNLQTVTSPKVISSFSSTAPAAGSGTATDLALGSTTDTLSSPFIDLGRDLAYVGNDTGTLFRLKDVFCTSSAACSGGTPPAPSLDTSWGSGGGLATGCTGKLTAPVKDSVTGNIFVGCSDGKLYGFTSSGGSLANSPLVVGDGTATGGIVDPVIIDPVNGFVFVTSVSSSTEILVQASTTDLSGKVTATLGPGTFPMHAGYFNDAYFSSGTSSSWLFYMMGLSGTNIALYGVGFGANHVMTSGAAGSVFAVGGSSAAEFSPLTEFLNGSTDQAFVSGLTSITPNFLAAQINAFPGSFASFTFASEGNGTSGIVIDNSSASNQASSMYFGTLVANTAVKLTQAGLN